MYVYCEVKETGEIYRANKVKVLQNIINEHKVSLLEAEEKLAKSNIDEPITIGNGEVAFLGR